MNNFFLLNEAIDLNNLTDFKTGMSELLIIERETEDRFIKHDNVWNINIIASLYSNFGHEEQAISKFIEQIKTVDAYINCEKVFDTTYEHMSNAFLGIEFSPTTVSAPKQIINSQTFTTFKTNTLWDVTFRNLWSKRTKLFPHLQLCGEVEEQLSKIGNSGYFKQIVDRLREFDNAVSNWSNGAFSYKDINAKYSLRISPESDKTMEKYGNERIFSLPKGGTEYFELHIKTGDLRFHFFADNQNQKVYVGYIGPHLSTVSN
jgi:hypothetical protein